MQTPPRIEEGRVGALEQVSRSAKALLDAWDTFLEVAADREQEVWVSPRVHSSLVALRRDIAGLGEFPDA